MNLAIRSRSPTPSFRRPTTGVGIIAPATTSFNYKTIGVNLTMTPRVTFDDEIILNPLSIENSSIGATINVGRHAAAVLLGPHRHDARSGCGTANRT